MNPVFIILVILTGILLWFLLAFAFKPIGKLLLMLWNDASDYINKDNEEKRKGDKEL